MLVKDWKASVQTATNRDGQTRPQTGTTSLPTIVRTIERGAIGKSGRLIMSKGMGDIHDNRIKQKLQTKHPERTEENDFTQELNTFYPHALPEICGHTIKSIMELPGFRANGPDGLRYEHLKAMTTHKVEKETREEVLRGLTWLMEEMARDALPPWLMQLWQSATLVAPIKKLGEGPDEAPDVRPVAITGALNRMFDRYVVRRMKEDYASTLLPAQLEVGPRGST